MRAVESVVISLVCGVPAAVAVGFGATFVADLIAPDPPGGHGGPGNAVFLFLGGQAGFVLGLVGAGVALGRAAARRRERHPGRRPEDDIADRRESRD